MCVSVWRGVIGPNDNRVGWQVQRNEITTNKRKQKTQQRKRVENGLLLDRAFLLRALTCSSTCK